MEAWRGQKKAYVDLEEDRYPFKKGHFDTSWEEVKCHLERAAACGKLGRGGDTTLLWWKNPRINWRGIVLEGLLLPPSGCPRSIGSIEIVSHDPWAERSEGNTEDRNNA